MIDKALSFLEKEVNNYFDARFGPSTQKWVMLGNIAKLDDGGNGNAGGNDNNSRAMLSLVNLEEDRIAKNPENFFRTPDGIAYRNPKILLNLYVLFAITSGNYTQGLQTLSFIIQCFQSNRVFESISYPLLDPSLEKLTLELYTLNFEQVNHLWSTLGGKYLPSVLYKVRVVGIEDTDRQVGGDLIREIVLNDRLIQ
ncbi:DUF4255 domain-containing protein [Spirosoma sp. KNUC1025]|uniref:DUF4255 domain-containing protein n=1 Tax=Spirosoma sp. KNUC1025 TaxID=2894082 RepID=UPI00386444C4|nr:DUF4255 domain-containing protein [Spirosoma sp. KNUC1025]